MNNIANNVADTMQVMDTTTQPGNNPMAEAKNEFAAIPNKPVQIGSSIHCQELVAYLILLIGIGVIVGLSLGEVISLPAGAIGGICGGLYVIHLLVGFICNPYFSSFSNVHHGSKFQSEYNNVRNLVGFFIFTAECYHYETRHHTRLVHTQHGTRTEHYTTQQKVVTHTDTYQLNPIECVDDSGPIQHVMAQKLIIFVHNYINHRFRDELSSQKYINEWTSFQQRNRFDAYQNYSHNFSVPNFKQRSCFYVRDNPSNYVCWFVIFSLVGFMWPVAMIIQQKICRFNISYIKVLTL